MEFKLNEFLGIYSHCWLLRRQIKSLTPSPGIIGSCRSLPYLDPPEGFSEALVRKDAGGAGAFGHQGQSSPAIQAARLPNA